ncbi:AMP-binding protein, partial [Frankia tisae]|uniref:AMP-binding protein n=2 Tax=Frankia tisae TaxID=2950104 RepID=UPI0021C16AB3
MCALPYPYELSAVAGDGTLVDAVWAQVAARPLAPAVVDGSLEWNYRQLRERVDTVAGQLLDTGVRRGDVVGLCAPRGRETVVGMLAALAVGAAFLPLDPHD